MVIFKVPTTTSGVPLGQGVYIAKITTRYVVTLGSGLKPIHKRYHTKSSTPLCSFRCSACVGDSRNLHNDSVNKKLPGNHIPGVYEGFGIQLADMNLTLLYKNTYLLGRYKTWTLDSGLHNGLNNELDFGLKSITYKLTQHFQALCQRLGFLHIFSQYTYQRLRLRKCIGRNVIVLQRLSTVQHITPIVKGLTCETIGQGVASKLIVYNLKQCVCTTNIP